MPSVRALTVNLSQFVGEDVNYADQIFQADGVAPQDITGWTINFSVTAYGDPSTVFIFKSTGGGGIVLSNPSQGQDVISVVHADTINMNPDQYSYYIERVDPGGDVVPTLGLFSLLRKASGRT
jgi:hypothetical protein